MADGYLLRPEARLLGLVEADDLPFFACGFTSIASLAEFCREMEPRAVE